MKQEESIYHGLSNLEPGMGTMRLDGDQPKYKHIKDRADKVILGIRELSGKEGIKVLANFLDKVIKFIKVLEVKKKKKVEVEEKKKA